MGSNDDILTKAFEKQQLFNCSSLGKIKWNRLKTNGLKTYLQFILFGCINDCDLTSTHRNFISKLEDNILKYQHDQTVQINCSYVFYLKDKAIIDIPLIRVKMDNSSPAELGTFVWIDVQGEVYDSWEKVINFEKFPFGIYVFACDGIYDDNVTKTFNSREGGTKVLRSKVDDYIDQILENMPLIQKVAIFSPTSGVVAAIFTATLSIYKAYREGDDINSLINKGLDVATDITHLVVNKSSLTGTIGNIIKTISNWLPRVKQFLPYISYINEYLMNLVQSCFSDHWIYKKVVESVRIVRSWWESCKRFFKRYIFNQVDFHSPSIESINSFHQSELHRQWSSFISHNYMPFEEVLKQMKENKRKDDLKNFVPFDIVLKQAEKRKREKQFENFVPFDEVLRQVLNHRREVLEARSQTAYSVYE